MPRAPARGRSDGDSFRLSEAEAVACGKSRGLVDPVNTPRALAETPDGTLYAATDCGLLRSADGRAWHALTAAPRGLGAVAVLAGDVLLVRVATVLARSADGGATWTTLDVPRLAGVPRGGAAYAALATDGDRTAFALVSGRLFASADAGRSWARAGDGLPEGGASALAETDDGALLAGTARGVFAARGR